MTKRWENCCWSQPSAGSNVRNWSPPTPSSGQPGLALMGLYCFCASAAHLPLSWRGGQERGAVGPLLEREGRKCPSKWGSCSEPKSRQQSSVFALPPWREEPFRQGHPSSPRCPVSVVAGTGHTLALPQAPPLPHALPAAPTTPAHGRLGLSLPLPLLASAPLPRQGCLRGHWLVVDDCCGHAEGFLQALLLFQLHSNVGDMGGGQQCHLLMTEQGDVRFL